jgi:hypothetical protein
MDRIGLEFRLYRLDVDRLGCGEFLQRWVSTSNTFNVRPLAA